MASTVKRDLSDSSCSSDNDDPHHSTKKKLPKMIQRSSGVQEKGSMYNEQPRAYKGYKRKHREESESDSDGKEEPGHSPQKKQHVTYAGKMMAYAGYNKKLIKESGSDSEGNEEPGYSPKKKQPDTVAEKTMAYAGYNKKRSKESGSDSDGNKGPRQSLKKKQHVTVAERTMANKGYKRKRSKESGSDSEGNEESGHSPNKKQHVTVPGTVAEQMMAKMGYKKGTGLGKNAQGRVAIVEASMQRGRRGLGHTVKGLEPSMDIEWNEKDDEVVIDETVEWLPSYQEEVPSIETLRSWKVVGDKKRTLDDENDFCNDFILDGVLSCKSIFDNLEPEEMRKARTKSNPYETIRGVFFLNRAAMKMANMDAVLDFMFTNPKYSDGKPMVKPNELLYFADICAGPGGFSEYVLWRTKGETKGFGLTLRGSCDFKLENFFAGPPEMFEPHYGVRGNDGDGDIFNPDNQAVFIQYVLENTRSMNEEDASEEKEGVHMVMADGGFSVEGEENIQEILSKQLYLCQFLVAISILRTGGHFVCKLFDLFTPFSVGLVYLMNTIFEQVSIFKPVTSRPANSERYIVCKGMRSKKEKEPVRQYFHEINLDLNTYLMSTSKQDINHIVPMEKLKEDVDFYNYICASNDSLGELQMLNLKKIRAFTQNTNLYEHRQNYVRSTLLKKWMVPDEVRTAPPKSRPFEKATNLIKGDMDFLDHVTEKLSVENIRTIKGVYDYRCMVTGDSPDAHVYILGLGRTVVFQRFCRPGTYWGKLQNVKLELPRDTLLEAEIVTEFRGEGTGQRKMTTVHVLDALFLYGKDVRSLNYNERIEKLRRFVKSITKLTRSDLVRVIVPEIFRFEEINQIYHQLQMKKVKGGGQGEKLCYCPRYNPENRFFRPTGVYIIRTVRDPWTMQWSRSSKRKYFFNHKDRQSVYDCPPDSIASVRDTKLNSYHWAWEEGVKLLDEQPGKVDDSKLSKADVMEYLRRLMPPK